MTIAERIEDMSPTGTLRLILAAVLEGRRALGAELTRSTCRAARRRLQEAA